MVWAPPTMGDTGIIDMSKNIYSIVMHKLCEPTLVLLSQSEGLVWCIIVLHLLLDGGHFGHCPP